MSSDEDGHRIGPGSFVGPYRVICEIGRGGMGVVYRARDEKLEREVALKRPHARLVDRPSVVERFLLEARTASQLQHPHIVTVFQAFEHGGLPWIATELVVGDTLRGILDTEGPLAPEDALRHAEGLAEALQAAHDRKILHRDVKPQNILIGADGRARLADFGLARVFVPPGEESVAPTRGPSLTADGHVPGTPGYMSPEQLLEKPVDPRSDLFCLGLVVYEMCTGKPAFPVGGRESWIDGVLHRDPPDIADLNPAVPQELRRIVGKALAKRPDERYQHAGDLASDLRCLRRKLESGVHSQDTMPPRRKIPRWAVVAAALLVATGAIVATRRIAGSIGNGRGIETRPRQITTAPATEAEPAISPDGSLIAYTAESSGQVDLWVTNVHGGSGLRLTDDTDIEGEPGWLPDGSAIVFSSLQGGMTSTFKISPLGGPPQLVVPDAWGPAISPDGKRIAFARADAEGHYRVAVAPLDDPARATFVTREGDGVHWQIMPAWSPDGSTLCYEDFRDIWVIPAAGGKARRLTTEDVWAARCRWSADGKWIYHSSLREGTRALWRIPAAGGSPERITLGTGPEVEPSVSRDGSKLVYSTHVDDSNVVVLDTRTGTASRLASVRSEDAPGIARDGSAVAFGSSREGTWDLWVQRLAAGKPEGPPRRLTELPGTAGLACFSPDGRWIAYLRVVDTQRDVWAVPTAGGLPQRLTDDPSVDTMPAWSPDGAFVAFSSNRSGTESIWAVPVVEGKPAGPARRITSGDSRDLLPDWSPDGRSIAYLACSATECGVAVARADGSSKPRVVLRGGLDPNQVRFEGTGRSLLVSGSWNDGPEEIRRVDLATGTVAPLATPVNFGGKVQGYFSVTSDGRYLAFLQWERRGDIWVLEGKPGTF